MAKTCTYPTCTRGCYGEFCLLHKPRKPLPLPTKRIRQRSNKQLEYEVWKELEARPMLIARDGNVCSCCAVRYPLTHKLDIEHTLTKGSRPDLKRELTNLTLMDRYCHSRKTDGLPCPH